MIPTSFWGRVGLGAGVCLALVVVRLFAAPLTVPFGEALFARVAGEAAGAMGVERVAVQLRPRGVDVVLRGVSGTAGGASLSVGRIALGLGFGPRTVSVVAPQVRVEPSGEGVPSVPLPQVALTRLGDALGALAEGMRASDVARVRVAQGRVELVPAGRPDAVRVLRDVAATVRLTGDARLTASGSLAGAQGTMAFTAERTGGDERLFTLAADGIVPGDLLPIEPLQSGFALAPRLSVRWDGDGAPQSARLTLDVGSGVVKFGRDPPRTLDRASAELAWAAGAREVEVRAVRVLAGRTAMTVAGTLTPAERAPWRFALHSDDALFDAPDYDGPSVAVTRIAGTGRLDFAQRLIHVDRFEGTMPAGRIDAVMTFDLSAGGPYVSGSAHVGPSTIPALSAVWPPVMAYEPRKAVLNTVLGGILREADVTFALTKPDFDGDPDTHSTLEGAMAVDAAFLDATLTVPELPLAIHRARGTLRMRDKSLRAVIRTGIVPIPDALAAPEAPRPDDPARPIADAVASLEALPEGEADGSGNDGATEDVLIVEEGELVIDRLDEKPVMARAKLTVRAPLSAAVRLANLFGVEEVSGTPISPDDVDGTLRATLSLRTPLAPDVPQSQRAWSIEARLVDASSKVPVGGQVFSEANVELAINARRLAARGRALIDGLRVEVNYSELFAGEKSGAARIVLSDEDRRNKGFDTGPWITGPVTVTIEAGSGDEKALVADLTDAEVAIPGFDKAKGEPLSAEGRLVSAGESTAVEGVRVDGSGVDIAGDLALQDNALVSARFPRVALSPGDDARLTVERRGDLYLVTANASRFDARGALAALRQGFGGGDGGEGGGPDLSLTVAAERVRIDDAASVADLSLDLQRRDGATARITASGKIDGDAAGSFGLTYGGDGPSKRLRADVTSLGRLLSAAGIYDRLRGGRTIVDATVGRDAILRGRAVAQSFTIVNERTLDELVERARTKEYASLERNVLSAPGSTAARAGDGIPFDELVVDFERRGGTVIIREAILRGPVMGGTAEGVVDLDAGLMRLTGTFIPAYGVNNLFGRLPLFGEILGGGNKGGLIGVTFRLSGPLDDPRVAINPISAIAPGIFRRIFEFR